MRWCWQYFRCHLARRHFDAGRFALFGHRAVPRATIAA
jgi:hypothetical protein